MDVFTEQPPEKRIRGLLTMLFSGVMAAVLVTLTGLYYYGPTDSYAAKKILFPPTAAPPFMLDHIEFSYLQERGWNHITIDKDRYQRFYELVKNEKSLAPSNHLENLFHNPHATLTLTIKRDKQDNFRKLQEVQFNEDYYRIQLYEEGSAMNWIYFYHPSITQEASNIFSHE